MLSESDDTAIGRLDHESIAALFSPMMDEPWFTNSLKEDENEMYLLKVVDPTNMLDNDKRLNHSPNGRLFINEEDGLADPIMSTELLSNIFEEDVKDKTPTNDIGIQLPWNINGIGSLRKPFHYHGEESCLIPVPWGSDDEEEEEKEEEIESMVPETLETLYNEQVDSLIYPDITESIEPKEEAKALYGDSWNTVEHVVSSLDPLAQQHILKTYTSGNLKQKRTSKFRGVSCCGKDRKWQARIRESNRVRYLGRFQTEVEAAVVYDEASRLCKGASAPTNFVPMTPELMKKVQDAYEKLGCIPDFLKHLIANPRKTTPKRPTVKRPYTPKSSTVAAKRPYAKRRGKEPDFGQLDLAQIKAEASTEGQNRL